jgi:hypothetical protein
VQINAVADATFNGCPQKKQSGGALERSAIAFRQYRGGAVASLVRLSSDAAMYGIGHKSRVLKDTFAWTVSIRVDYEPDGPATPGS